MVHGKWLYYTDKLNDIKKVVEGVYGSFEVTDDDFYGYNIVVFDNETPVCCGRLNQKNNKFIIGRLCTLPEKRGCAYADLALRMMVRKAFDMGAENVSVLSDEKGSTYFLRLGFKVIEKTEKGVFMTKFEDVGGCCKN